MSEAEDFLKQKHLFQLGDLPTETPHPLTTDLSRLAVTDIGQGLRVLRQIDLAALKKVARDFNLYRPLFAAVAKTVLRGDRIFLVGCGATGRLSLSLEFLWRRRRPGSNQVCSLMAGGDVALVHSLEGFEDFQQYGARHLEQLGFTARDLLIGTTEGGETPYVIGAVERASETGTQAPFFLFCNPRDILLAKVERSRRVLQNPKIQAICLETGPMALTGSTRMQASTVLMLMVGLALEFYDDPARAESLLNEWIAFLETSSVAEVADFVVDESAVYAAGDYTCYRSDDLAITVFTDTTERAPTFNLAPFDNPKFPSEKHSLTYVSIPAAADAGEAWRLLLARDPRPIAWPEVHVKTSAEYLLSFDFGRLALEYRRRLIGGRRQVEFDVAFADGGLRWRFAGREVRFPLLGKSELLDHLTAKMLLNMHSTLVMGRLGRFEGNLMTWVFPSNGKLVDRAARYTQILLRQRGHEEFDYDSIVRAQFECKAKLSPKESIVHKTIDLLLGE